LSHILYFQEGVLEEYKICDKKPIRGDNEQVVELGEKEKKYLLYKKPIVPKYDALKEELIHFVDSIQKEKQPDTDGVSATEALSLALDIQKIIDQ
jgi:hypothetical protein